MQRRTLIIPPWHRLTRDGVVDTSFGDNGRLITIFSEEGDSARAVALDSAGRIVVAGTSNNAFLVARFSPDGVLDTTFGNQGQATTDGAESSVLGYAVALDSAGHIIVAGDSAVTRFTPDGALDATFGDDGIVTTGPGPEYAPWFGMALNRAERIIVAGGQWDNNTGQNDAIIGRYNTDGAPDDTFGGDGIVTSNFGGDSEGKAVAIDGAGRIVVVGDLPSSSGAGLARYQPDGALDVTFGDRGTLVFPGRYLYSTSLSAIAIDNVNRIVATGWSSWGRPPFFALQIGRITPTGAPDYSFASGGWVTVLSSTGRPDHQPWGSAVMVDSTNHILAAGSTCAEGAFGCDLAPVLTVARIREDGSRDMSFGSDGYATVDFGGQDNDVRAISGDSLFNRIVVAGWVGSSGGRDVALIRFNPDGSPDLSFSDDGVLTLDLGRDDIAAAVAIDADDRIIVAGSSDGDFAILRFNTDGALDATFDGDGIQITDLGGVENGTGVAVDRAGRIVVSGTVNGDFAALRLNPNGRRTRPSAAGTAS